MSRSAGTCQERKFDALAASWSAPPVPALTHMRVVIAPVLVGKRIVRLVAPLDSLLEVEEWVGEWWEPTDVTLTVASRAPSAPFALLRRRGVPAEDCVVGPRPTDAEIQALMHAAEPRESLTDPPWGRPNRIS